MDRLRLCMMLVTACALVLCVMAVVVMAMVRSAMTAYEQAHAARRTASAAELDAKVAVVRAGLYELNHWRQVNGLEPIEMSNEWEVSIDP